MTVSKEVKYDLNGNGEFIIENYNSAKLFSSFFPGVAGKEGIPMWVFYVNRGQCICSMGIQDKENPIMEFLPANRAYQLTSTQGFRTFLKIRRGQDDIFYEPFQDNLPFRYHEKTQRMIIEPSRLIIEESNETLGLFFRAEYFNIPQDSFGGLVRILTVRNTGAGNVSIEGLDGLPLIIPHGIDNGGLKFIRRLVEAFVEVVNYENGVPFFRGKVKPTDTPEVIRIERGNFYAGFDSEGLIKPIVDPVRVFGTKSDFCFPENFLDSEGSALYEGQVLENRLPCAMGLFKTELAQGEQYEYNSVIGHACSQNELNDLIPRITRREYIAEKSAQDRELIDELTQNCFVSSSNKVFDRYARVNFLDNTLRGGFPFTIKGKESSFTLHLFSRKHGDLERDYNHYQLMPTHYSQGNGNFRDVNQNRRNDLFFNPDVKDANVIQFYNLIQLDGFNPLVIKETRFRVKDKTSADRLLSGYFGETDTAGLSEALKSSFTPGEITSCLARKGISVNGSTESFLADLVNISERLYDTAYGESFWTDHWTYNLDLLENYLSVYPEELVTILFEKKHFNFYDNPHRVKPREEKYVIWNKKPMQLGSVVFDDEKDRLINSRTTDKNKVRTSYGTGQVYSTSLFTVMLCLIANKMASLDPEGTGVEMESDKPNWYDALNGLPALVGSSISETIETKRHILFLRKALSEIFIIDGWPVFAELKEFIAELGSLLEQKLPAFDYWDRSYSVKESYRNRTRLGISGEESVITRSELERFFSACLKKLDDGIAKAVDNGNKILSTYFINSVTDYEILEDENGVRRNDKGLECFKALKFEQIHLPLFLEGPVHYLRCHKDKDRSLAITEAIKNSGLYDKKLKMYKVNATLKDQAPEIGRARTFSPGWFENESVWMHMEYKYMLEMLRCGLYERFYDDFKNVFVPFFDPKVYGRSILENSSFIVSSSNPDPSIHGNGFVARLSGATAEFIHILLMMAVGEKPFAADKEKGLALEFKPALKSWMFTEDESLHDLRTDSGCEKIRLEKNTFAFMFLGSILVTYHNPKMLDTFGPNGVKPVNIEIIGRDGEVYTVKDDVIYGKPALDIRCRKINRINIELE